MADDVQQCAADFRAYAESRAFSEAIDRGLVKYPGSKDGKIEAIDVRPKTTFVHQRVHT